MDEKAKLEAIGQKGLYRGGLGREMVLYTFEVFSRHFRPGNTLELGPAEGDMTRLLADRFSSMTVVEGAASFVENIRKAHPQMEVVHSLFEDFRTEKRFDNIVLGHVLEHVADPVAVLRHFSEFLAPGGIMLCAVPNARSVHRQAAVIMGQLATEWTLNATDVAFGHYRVYNPEQFRAEFTHAGLAIEFFGGYWLKPLSYAQIEASWTPEMIRAFFVLGERYPDVAAEIYVIARRL